MQRLVIAIGCSALLLASVANADELEKVNLVKLHYSLAGFATKSWGIVKSRDPQAYAIRFDGKPVEAVEKPNAEQLAKERRKMLEEVSDLVRNSVYPATWKSATGEGTITIGDDGLTISQTPVVHEAIGDLLHQFYRLQAAQVAFKVETYQVPRDAFERWMLDPEKQARLLTADERAELLVKEKPEAMGKATINVPNGQIAQVHAPDAAALKVLEVSAVIRADLKGVRLTLPDEITKARAMLEFGDAVLVSLDPPDAEEAHRYVCVITPHVEIVKFADRPWEGK